MRLERRQAKLGDSAPPPTKPGSQEKGLRDFIASASETDKHKLKVGIKCFNIELLFVAVVRALCVVVLCVRFALCVLLSNLRPMNPIASVPLHVDTLFCAVCVLADHFGRFLRH